MSAIGVERLGIVLSAGASRRWGGRPKALLPLGGRPALARILDRLRAAGVPRIRVVVGPEGPQIRAGIGAAESETVEWRTNPDRDSGPLGSVRVGLDGPTGATWIVLWPVDHPFVGPETLPALLRAAGSDPECRWIGPVYGGRGGHPVVLAASESRRVASLPRGATLRTLRDDLGEGVRRLAVPDAGVTVNLNTPEEYHAVVDRIRSRSEGEWTVP
ncbi:MAG: nucleotidyltransferase family protein [Thermoplasmata archaeon]